MYTHLQRFRMIALKIQVKQMNDQVVCDNLGWICNLRLSTLRNTQSFN